MDPEEERVLYLARAGKEKIFKHGTYNIMQQRAITQEHPFYVKREDGMQKISYIPPQDAQQLQQDMASMQGPSGMSDTASPPPPEPEADPAALAAQVISSNFKVGLSQEEVDALLNGMS